MRNVLCPCSGFDSVAVIPGDSSRPRGEGRSQQTRTLWISSHPDLEPCSLFSFARPVSFLYLKCWGSSVYGFSCLQSVCGLLRNLCPQFYTTHLTSRLDFPQTPPIEPVCIPLFLSTLSGIFTHQNAQAEIWVSYLTLPSLAPAHVQSAAKPLVSLQPLFQLIPMSLKMIEIASSLASDCQYVSSPLCSRLFLIVGHVLTLNQAFLLVIVFPQLTVHFMRSRIVCS